MVACTTSTSTQTATTTSLSGSANALQLQLAVNASGGVVSVMADDYNTLASRNNVTAANDWLVTLGYLDGAPCWVSGFTVGFAIAEGHYTSSNFTSAKFLDLSTRESPTAARCISGTETRRGLPSSP